MLVLIALPSLAKAQCLQAPVKDLTAGTVISVSNVDELQNAVRNAVSGTTIQILPGQYRLTTTLYVRVPDVVITGDPANCDAVQLIGRGMENSDFGDVRSGVWIDADGVTVANLTVRDTYFHTIELNSGPDDIYIYNVRLVNAGTQFIKGNSNGGFGLGADRGRVEYTVMEYLNGPPMTDRGIGTGYSNGVDVHGGADWQIRNNLFKNFHTPDHADFLHNPAILMWNGSSNTISENNTFINVDRAIAYGLVGRENDHQGGVIKNNFIYMAPGLYSANRTLNSDAPIINWSSPGTKIAHNTVRTNGNMPKSIEIRFNSQGAEVINNLVDATILHRDGSAFVSQGNGTIQSGAFVNESAGDLHLSKTNAARYLTGARLSDVTTDFDGDPRGTSIVYIGADAIASEIGLVPVNGVNLMPIMMLLEEDETNIKQ